MALQCCSTPSGMNQEKPRYYFIFSCEYSVTTTNKKRLEPLMELPAIAILMATTLLFKAQEEELYNSTPQS
jgi:hypothetical protein